MCTAVNGAGARHLVVEPGARVRAEGRFVQLDDSDWLDLAQVDDLVGRSGPWKSQRSVRLVGADGAAISSAGRLGDQSVMPGRLRVVGVWRDEVITVEAQSLVPWPTPTGPEPLLALPAPVGGWDVTQQSQDIHGLAELRAAGTIVRDGWLCEHGGALLLRVATSDVAAVERVLAAQLPRGLCLVLSRYTAAELREVEDMFNAHAEEWDFGSWSCQGMDAQYQPCADAVLTRVTADLAAWADTLPA